MCVCHADTADTRDGDGMQYWLALMPTLTCCHCTAAATARVHQRRRRSGRGWTLAHWLWQWARRAARWLRRRAAPACRAWSLSCRRRCGPLWRRSPRHMQQRQAPQKVCCLLARTAALCARALWLHYTLAVPRFCSILQRLRRPAWRSGSRSSRLAAPWTWWHARCTRHTHRGTRSHQPRATGSRVARWACRPRERCRHPATRLVRLPAVQQRSHSTAWCRDCKHRWCACSSSCVQRSCRCSSSAARAAYLRRAERARGPQQPGRSDSAGNRPRACRARYVRHAAAATATTRQASAAARVATCMPASVMAPAVTQAVPRGGTATLQAQQLRAAQAGGVLTAAAAACPQQQSKCAGPAAVRPAWPPWHQ
jgi:hypothetical protein